MAKVILTREAKLADRIITGLKASGSVRIGKLLGISQQTASYRINEKYPKEFAEFVLLLDEVGYEIREKE